MKSNEENSESKIEIDVVDTEKSVNDEKKEKKKKIVGFLSATGNQFLIEMRKKGQYHLKNKYTEVPNEFGRYSIQAVEKLFKDLKRVMHACEPAESQSGHRNSCFYVIYEDNTRQLMKEKEDSRMNVCAFTANAAMYSEFFPDHFHYSEVVTLDHLRDVCESGTEAYDIFLQAVGDMVRDGETDVVPHIYEFGEIEINMDVYGREYSFIRIGADGMIQKTGNSVAEPEYVKLLQDQGVKIVRLDRVT